MILQSLESLGIKVHNLIAENKKLKEEIKELKLLLGKNKKEGGAIG